jgi:glutamate N-acetyltransferase/amino-acid N-acetyltransferase
MGCMEYSFRMLITDIKGVFAAGIHCGIKPTKALDLAYIYVPDCVGSAVVLSKNLIRSVTLEHNETVFNAGPVKLMVINSGNANSVTGELGMRHVEQTVKKAALVFGCSPHEIGVASTGIIGVPLPIECILNGLDHFTGKERLGDACATAILTTDLTQKKAHKTIQIQGKDIHFAGITKGSGMISPNMATTLGFIATNVALDCTLCQSLLQSSINQSYNMLSVDTDQSTNDMVSLQSTGEIQLDLAPNDILAIEYALTELCIDLAKQIAKDGEGAQHVIEVHVTGAHSKQDARRVAKLVVDSPLVKTAIAGEDPNWGRILMALGKDPSVQIDQACLSIQLNGHPIFTNGKPEIINLTALKTLMAQPTVVITIAIANGGFEATAWGCDLTQGYVDINTAYN